LHVEVGELIYLNEFFQASAFNQDDQLIAIYYRVLLPSQSAIFTIQGDKTEQLRWKPLSQLTPEDLTFPVDKKLVEVLKSKFLS